MQTEVPWSSDLNRLKAFHLVLEGRNPTIDYEFEHVFRASTPKHALASFRCLVEAIIYQTYESESGKEINQPGKATAKGLLGYLVKNGRIETMAASSFRNCLNLGNLGVHTYKVDVQQIHEIFPSITNVLLWYVSDLGLRAELEAVDSKDSERPRPKTGRSSASRPQQRREGATARGRKRGLSLWLGGALLALLGTAALILWMRSSAPRGSEIGAIFPKPDAAVRPHRRVLRFGVVNYKGEQAIRQTYTPFVRYLGRKLGWDSSLEILDYARLARKLQENHYDIGVFSPFAYIEAHRDYPDLRVFAIHQAKGRTSYRAVILVRKGSGIHSLRDLKGKKLLFAHVKSTSGFQYPVKYLRQAGIDPDTYFVSAFSGSHHNSIKALAAGRADAIATYKEALDDYEPGMINKFRTIYTSGPIPYNAYVFSPAMKQSDRARIKELLFHAHQDREAGNMFKNRLRIQRWMPCQDTEYHSLRRYLDFKRTKQVVLFSLKIKQSARTALGGTDIADEIGDRTRLLIGQTHRFLIPKTTRKGEFSKPQSRLLVTLYMHSQGKFSYSIQSITPKEVRSDRGTITRARLSALLPELIVQSLQRAHPIQARLHYDLKHWFVTYGLDDGVTHDFQFVVQRAGHPPLTIRGDQVKIIKASSLLPNRLAAKYKKKSKVMIRFPARHQ